MPSVITKYQKKQTVAQLKKAYSVVSQALVTAQYENGDMSEWGINNMGNTNEGGNSSDENYAILVSNFVNKYFVPYLNVRDNCGINCIRQKGVKRYRLNGDEWDWMGRFYYVVYMSDGTIISFMFDNINGRLMFVYMYVDINGDKKPNRAGRDIFSFGFGGNSTAKVNMVGVGNSRDYLLSTSSRNGCNKSAGAYAGDYCGAVIQYDGWEIKDDYPW